MTKVLLCTFGSLGDIYPYLAIAAELRRRGAEPVIATSEYHRSLIAGQGFQLRPIRPELEQHFDSPDEFAKQVLDEKTGSEFVIREILMKHLRDSYEDYLAASEDVDLIVTHPVTFGAVLAARVRRKPWLATALAPVSTWSDYDPPAMPQAKWLPRARRLLGVRTMRLLTKAIKRQVYPWTQPYRSLELELGLPVRKESPLFAGQFSPSRNLALFSPLFAAPQPDWPINSSAVGFPFIDDPEYSNPDLDEFLASGPDPIVFTLGSSAVQDPGQFWSESIATTRRLGARAVLLVGDKLGDELRRTLPPTIAAFDYLPHSQIFPKAAAIVHQGGIGTAAQALRSGKPQLVMPFSHDQFDNAYRIKQMRCGTSISRKRYTARLATKTLTALLAEPYLTTARDLGQLIGAERGAAAAAEAMLELIPAAQP